MPTPTSTTGHVDEAIAVSWWASEVRRELAEFNEEGADLFVNLRGVVALARATAERIGHPVTSDLLWWARALDRWATRAREKDARIAELRARVVELEHEVKETHRASEALDAENQRTLNEIADLVRPGEVLDEPALLEAVRALVVASGGRS